MATDERGPPGKKPAPVRVFHFPKKGKASAVEARGARRVTLETKEAWDEEGITEPYFIPEEAAPRVTPPWPRPETASVPARRAPSKGRERKKRPSAKKRAKPPTPTAAANREQVAELSVVGHRLFEEGRIEEAREVFEGLVALNVSDPFPHTMLGTVYLALGDPERALALFQASLEIDRTDVAALVYRGEIRLNRGKLKPALVDLNRAIEVAPPDDPFVERARRLLRMASDKSRRPRR